MVGHDSLIQAGVQRWQEDRKTGKTSELPVSKTQTGERRKADLSAGRYTPTGGWLNKKLGPYDVRRALARMAVLERLQSR